MTAVGGWIAAHRSLVSTATASVAIAAVVATAAVASTGYAAQRVDLDDAAVWISSDERQAVARADTQVRQLNAVVPTGGSLVEVVQDGPRVLVVDDGESTMTPVDPATGELGDPVPLPPAAPEVAMSGDDVVVFETGTGSLFTVPFDDLGSFDAAREPDAEFGAGSVAAVGPGGAVVFSPELQTVSELALDGVATVARTVPVALGDPDDDYAATLVGGDWAVLDATTGALALDGARIGLDGDLDPGSARLQEPSADGSVVYLADDSGVVGVPLDGSAALGMPAPGGGRPAAPVQAGGCVFAAWSAGSVWRSCGATAVTLALDGVPASAALAFQVSGDAVVLADDVTGVAWAVQASGEVIDDWDALLEQERTEQQVEVDAVDAPPELEPAQEPPVAVDDAFGARPGRTSALPVLLNDYDPNGDVLVVSEVGAIDPELGRIDLVGDGQQLQVTLEDDASGSVTVPYTVTDGRGGSASATLTVTVRSADENGPPAQVRTTRAAVAEGGQVTAQVLGDWVDPDGDPVYLTSAAAPEPDAVAFQPGGLVTFTDQGGVAGEGAAQRIVALEVGDGRATGGGRLEIAVAEAGEVPIVAEPFVVTADAGEQVTISPLERVRGGTGAVTLNSVPAKTGATIVPSYEDGTFTFTSSEIRTHYLDYSVTDGVQTATGLIRVEVTAPPEPTSRPITVPKTVFVETLSSRTVDVAGTDIDPAGGVLLVTGVDDLPAEGLRADVLAQRDIRVTLTAPLEGGTATFGYRVTNGLAEAAGTVTVIEIPPPVALQPPIAQPDAVTVRAGEVVDVPVLDNDVQPDGQELELLPDLVSDVGADGGLLFASGDRLRYLAPRTVGDYVGIYSVSGPDGQTASAPVRLSVREPDPATNNPPVPRVVDARVVAGGTVRVQIPLAGIDPDGDAVQLLGPESAPQRGTASDTGADWIEYEAGAYSSGTDTFTYSVVDGFGARATGTVRVGIAPRADGAREPVAVEDSATVQPGRTVAVQVLANDFDPDGSALTVTDAVVSDPASGATASIDGDLVRITPPREPGDYGLVYTIENASGGTSSNFVTVTVDPDAPLARPVAADTVLALSDVLGRDQVDVDVLQDVFFADGDARSLDLGVLAGWRDAARVLPDGRIRVQVEELSQIIPFRLAHPDDPDVVSYAFIRVPGTDDALPQLDRTARPLEVVSEQALTIDINDHVVAVGGRGVRLTDASRVRVTHSDGTDPVVDGTTLRFRSADLYFGPAAISFEVTDGVSATDPGARIATVVLPIDVRPRENQPPVFQGGTVSFEPGEERQLDLGRLTDYPYPDDAAELEYALASRVPAGFSARIDGTRIVVRADAGTPRGTSASLAVGVRDAVRSGTAGRLTLQVVPSTRPLARPAADVASVQRGTTTTIDVLDNDRATNPFPATALRVVAIRGVDDGSLPAGIAVRPSSDGARLTVTVASDAPPGTASLQYQVADATGDPDRNVWGTVSVSVQDVPDTPGVPQLVGVADRAVTMRWNAPAANNSPITGYRATLVGDGGDGRTVSCPGTTCILPTEGNGPGQRVRVRVVATNALGDSAPVTSEPVWSDVLPGAPTDVVVRAGDGELSVAWDAPSGNGGSGATNYLVTWDGGSQTVTGTQTRITGLVNGTRYGVTVISRNSAYNPSGFWNSAAPVSGTPFGAPIPGGARAVSANEQGHVDVSWDAFGRNGGAAVTYAVGRFRSPPSALACTGGATGSRPGQIADGVAGSWRDTSAPETGASYSYVVYGYTDTACSIATAGAVDRPPGQAAGSVRIAQTGSTGYFDIQAGDDLRAEGSVGQYQASVDGGASWIATAPGARITSPARGLYGTPTSVLLRACRSADGALCGPAGTADPTGLVPVATRVTQATCTPDGALAVQAPTTGPGVTEVTYRVSWGRAGALGVVVFDPGYTAFDPGTGRVPADAVAVRVEGGVATGSPSTLYRDPSPADAQFACS